MTNISMAKHISTKTGDKGESKLFGGGCYKKTDSVYELLGTIDEFSAGLGLAKGKVADKFIERLEEMQRDLLNLGAYIASSCGKGEVTEFNESSLLAIEMELAEMEEKLPELSEFILAGGENGAAELHFARTICRRAERLYWGNEKLNKLGGAYLNRLSDYLFQLARFVTLT